MTPAPDPVFDLQLTTLQLSDVRRLERMHHSEWLPHGARLVRGGVGMEPNGDLSGWLAYANTEGDLQLPSWPEWTVPVRLDDVLPATVEVVGLYHGGEWRRAVGAVNARLNEEARSRAGIAADLVERAWLTLRSATTRSSSGRPSGSTGMAARHSSRRVDAIRGGRYDWHMNLRWERA